LTITGLRPQTGRLKTIEALLARHDPSVGFRRS